MVEKTNKPLIRFKGFSDPWVQRKLGEVFKTYSGQTPLRSEASNFENPTIPWIKTTDLNNGEILNNDEDISDVGAKTLKLLPSGTVLIAMYGGFNQIGRTGLLSYPATINQALTALEPNKEVEPYFLITELNYKAGDWKIFAASSRKDPNITKKDIESFAFCFPALKEQTSIGNFFRTLDNIIASGQRKLEGLKELKKGYLQQMFPQNGERVPRVRFEGFGGEWEQQKLGDVLQDVGTGKSKFTSNEKSDVYKYAVLGSTSVIGYDDNYDYEGDFILTARVGANAGTMYRHKGQVKISDNTVYLQGENLEFMQALLTNFDLTKLSFGTGQPLIKSSELKGLTILTPSTKEQTTIGNFFRTLDNIIASGQRKLEGLKELKKGYLQQMFPQSGERVPRVRFSGFTDDWQERKLGNEADISAGGDIDKDKILAHGKYPVYANALTNDGIVGYYENDFRIKAPAVTVTGRGDVGYAKARKVNFTPVVRLLAVKSKHDVDFLENAINNHNTFVESTGVPQLTVPQLAKYTISFPILIEQTAIGNFLRNFDNQINAQTQKIEELKQLKSAYLQKMFV